MTKIKRMGRPRLPKNAARSIMLSTRVTADEYGLIAEAIKNAAEDKTVWLRNALLKAASGLAA